MFKSTLFFIMTIMMCFTAEARSYVRSHVDFVHLSDYQKDQHIIKVMELVVELESKYEFETKKYGFNQNRFEKYQKALNKISSILFIPTAYAQGNFPASVSRSDWNGLGQRFGEILNRSEGGQNRCIFAGWISETARGDDGKTYCNHPTRSERAARGYPDPEASSGCARGNTNHIQCNPLIFGYKNAQSKSLFCVSTQSNAKNSSYHCMEKALGMVSEENADASANRLEALRANLSSNPAVFNQVQEFVYQTCVCESSHENFNSDYQSAIRPHRTCYGLMNMIGETISCENPRLPLADHGIFENLQAYMRTKSVSESNADSHYRQFLAQLNTDSAEYKRICKLQPDTPQEKSYVCKSATCTQAPGAEAPTCLYVVTEKNKEVPVTLSKTPTEVPAADATSVEINFEVEGVAASATCDNITRPAVAIEYECVATCNISGPVSAGENSTEATTTTAPSTEVTPPTVTPGCTISSLKIKGSQDAITPEVVTSPELPTEAGRSNLSFVLKINNEEKSVECVTNTNVIPRATTTEPDADEETNTDDSDTTPDLTVSITDPGETAYGITAVTTNDTGWTFSWDIQKPDGKEVEKSWAQTAVPETNVTAGIAQDGSQGTSSQPTTTATAVDKVITQTRYDFDYQVFGVLTKEGKEPIRKSVKVLKLKAAATPNRPMNVNPNLQPGNQMQIRGTSDASAIGIR